MRLHWLIIIVLMIFPASYCLAQEKDSAINSLESLPKDYYSKVDQKLASLNDRLTKKSLRYLTKYQQHENRLRKKLKSIYGDSSNTLSNPTEAYKQFSAKIKSKTAGLSGEQSTYNAYVDSLSTSLSFLRLFGTEGTDAGKPLASLQTLQSKFQQSEKIKEFVAQRKLQIKEALSRYSKLPPALTREYAKFNKSAYYYSAQVSEYKEMLKDPSKAESKALSLLSKLPAFQKFMRKNSQLATLFRMPDDNGTAESLAGLQTRASVQGIMQQRISAGGPNAQQLIQQNITQARDALNQLKDKVNKFGGTSSEADMPDFRLNDQKTKSFLKRLEYGANVQFAKSSNRFPSSTTIGLSLGYKLNDKSLLGIGLSYKFGMGTIRHIVLSHQGVGLRSFTEYKIKNSFFLSGGFEMNHNAAFKNIEQLKDFSAWQSSGLIGMSKKYAVSKKVKGNMQLLWDFLANTHRPVTQPVIFRTGFHF